MENEEIRSRILRTLYEQEMTKPGRFYDTDKLVKELGVATNVLEANLLYLLGKKLVTGVGELGRLTPRDIRISPLGIDVVEHPYWFERQFSINLQTVSIAGDVSGQFAVQQATQASQQLQVNESLSSALSSLVSELGEKMSELKLEEDKQRDLSADVETIKAQLTSTKPKHSIIKEALFSVRAILESAGAVMLAAKVAEVLATLK